MERKLTFALKSSSVVKCRIVRFASVYKRSHEFVSVHDSVGVGSDSISSNNKLNVRSVVRSKFGGVIF